MSLTLPASALGVLPRSLPRSRDAAATRSLPRLSRQVLAGLPASVRRPPFDARLLRAGLLHLGCGAFHRAHQALITQRAIGAEMKTRRLPGLAAVPPAWGIVSASLRTSTTVDALARQQGLYTVLEREAGRTRAEVVGTLCGQACVRGNPAAVEACFNDPRIRIVTLTVTAAGYGLDPAAGRLDPTHPDIHADLQGGTAPRSAIGLLVRGLALRRAAGLPPPVILSCDNMPRNGRTLRQACLDFASLRDDRLAAWIEAHVQFPCTMVDRIVPSTTQADRDEAQALLGATDAVPVSAEPFCQWVIERFEGPRPRWEAAGAEFLRDTAPWEAAKLRLLNGGHLALAYLGLLAGCDTMAEVMRQPDFAAFAQHYMLDEQQPTLPVGGPDAGAYAGQLLARWRNPAIVHRLGRIAREGSGKLPTRLLASLRDNLRAQRPAHCTVLALAAWMRCAAGRDEAGRPLRLEDDFFNRQADALGRLVACDNAAHSAEALLACTPVFGEDLSRHPALRRMLVQALAALQRGGVRGALAECLSGAWQT